MEDHQFGNWQEVLDNALCNCQELISSSNFASARKNEQRINTVRAERIIEREKWIVNYFKASEDKVGCRKLNDTALQWKTNGNLQFQRKQYPQALESYNQCILYAAKTGLELSLGYANRSAVLHHMHHYQECLADINRAFDAGYAVDLHYKLLQRRGQCKLQLLQYVESRKAFSSAMNTVSECKSLTKSKRDQLLATLQDWLRKVVKMEAEHGDQVENNQKKTIIEPLPALSYGVHKVLMQASEAVELSYNRDKGRHFVAIRDLVAGDTLVVERPYAAVLLPSHYSSHCHHCFGKLLAPVPCHQCCDVRYCDEKCRKASWDMYHHAECPYLDMLHATGVAHLSLRIILTAGWSFLQDFRKKYLTLANNHGNCDVRNTDVLKGLTPEGKYEKSYHTVFELMTHTDHMIPEDLFQYTLTSLLLLKLLEQTKFFNKKTLNSYKCHDASSSPTVAPSSNHCATQLAEINLEHNDHVAVESSDINTTQQSLIEPTCINQPPPESPLEEDLLFVGGLLLRHICQIVCNAHAITALQITQSLDSSLVESQSQIRVATAIYPTTSLMNHSCDPTIISSFHKDILVGRALRPVSKGEEIFTCYGPLCKRMSRADRQQALKEQYFFQCTCTACEQDEKELRFQALKCQSCGGPVIVQGEAKRCYDCHQAMEVRKELQIVMEAQNLFVQGITKLEQTDFTGALKCLEKCLELRQRVMYHYNKDLAEVKDAIARCHATLGNFPASCKYLSESITIIEEIYGSQSIELANELQKYAECLVHSESKHPEALKVARRAIGLFTLNYGDGHELVNELKQLISALLQLQK